jgi:hypothetical protein
MRLPSSGTVPCKAAHTVAELCNGCKENRIEFRKCLGMRPLVRLLNAGPDSSVTIAGSALISVLAVERENKVRPSKHALPRNSATHTEASHSFETGSTYFRHFEADIHDTSLALP